MRLTGPIFCVCALLLYGCGDRASDAPASTLASTAARPVLTGRVERWPEATAHLLVSIDGARASADVVASPGLGLVAFWSIASTSGAGSGFFYSDAHLGRSETRVAYAAGVARVQDIRDASRFDGSQPSVGPVAPPGIVLVHHLPSDRWLALVVDAIVALDPRDAGAGPYAYADVTWYLTEPGSADFSAAP